MKKHLSLAVVLGLLCSLLLIIPFSASANGSILIEDDFAAQQSDVAAANMKSTFPNLESADKARIKFSFGKGYLCPGGGGQEASIVYKVTVPAGQSLTALNLTVSGHFASRAGYNAEWNDPAYGKVAVSSNGTDYTEVKTWNGDVLNKADYAKDTDFSKLADKAYTADLLTAAGDAAAVYVKISWAVYDYPLYSSIHKVSITGATQGAASETEIKVGDVFSAQSGNISKDQMLTTFPNLVDSNNARVLSTYGRHLCPQGAGTAYVVYKVEVPQGEELTSLGVTVKGHFSSRAGKNPDWTDLPYGKVSVADTAKAYDALSAEDWTDVKTWEGDSLSMEDYPADTDFRNIPDQDYTADLLTAAGDAQGLYIKITWTVWDHPGYSSIHEIAIAGASKTPAPSVDPSSDPSSETSSQVPGDTSSDASGSTSSDSSSTPSAPSSDASQGGTPATGSTAPVAGAAAVILLAGCVLAVCRKRGENKA